MKIRKLIERSVRRSTDGVDVAGDLHAVVSANVNEPGRSTTHVSSRQTVVQRQGGGSNDGTQEPDRAQS